MFSPKLYNCNHAKRPRNELASYLTRQDTTMSRLGKKGEEIIIVCYGNTVYGVFKSGVKKFERFLPKNQHTQRKLLNFENWISMGLRSF